MNLDEIIFSTLSAAGSETAALLGSGDTCRLYPGHAPAVTPMPYAVTTLVSGTEVMTHGRSADLEESVVQFSCIAATHAEALALLAAIRADLQAADLGDGFFCRSGFTESIDAHVLIVEVTFWNQPATP